MSETPQIPGYRIVSVVGRGAMATVYRAEHERLGKTVALKIMDPVVAEDDEYRERFLREARAAAKLNHQNLVRALDSGYANGLYFLAMELVEGDDLRRRIETHGHVAEREALTIATSVAHALEESSRHGIVHRDVKPENILLARDGTVKLADLGLAKVQGEDATLTKKGLTVGTVAYFAPEQALGQPDLDVRTDLYALGATLYASLSGELPFGRGENAPETMKRILTEPPPPLEEIAPYVSPAACAAVARLMEKDRKRRPQTAREAVRVLERALKGEMPGHGTASTSGERRSSRTSGRQGSARTSRRRLAGKPAAAAGIGIGAAACAVVLAVTLLVILGPRGDDHAAAGGHGAPGSAPGSPAGGERAPLATMKPAPLAAEPPRSPSELPLTADSEAGRALVELVHAKVTFQRDDQVTLDFDAARSSTRPDWDVVEGPDPDLAGGGLAWQLAAGESSSLRLRAFLAPPVSVRFELVVADAIPEARFAAVLLDERGDGLGLAGDGRPGGSRLEAWTKNAPAGRLGGSAGVAAVAAGTHRVAISFGAAGTEASVDGSPPLEVATRAPRAAQLGFELSGALRAQVRHLTVSGRVDRSWLAAAQARRAAGFPAEEAPR